MASSQNDLIAKARFSARECGGPGQDRCNFFNGPVQLVNTPVRVATRSAEFFPTANRLEFVDSEASRWIAPQRTLTDGASIPAIFVPIIGARRSPEFVNAAAMHDAHCGIGNETLPEYHSRTWEETHRMFYDALRAGGTEELRAKVMFAAVYLGGPRWQDDKRSLKHAPLRKMRRTMREARNYIMQTKPTPTRAEIELWIKRREPWILREDEDNVDGFHRVLRQASGTLADDPTGPGDQPADPGEGPTIPGDGCTFEGGCDPARGS
ncbi:DUF1353 domain-containing protein [Primorskyibacter aestuariivivens]|uniref:DUF1353 domain-containing protein n=1 Tax=Primorskyibacter aestuariivivens TaxID=1888912 RepID=UPI0023018EC2|nr:DUF1353 domain-containing protein [Primorskyibacter aestuariivivens]MDA7427447.1 DUF1353 domain-containing protein [Primorskyibacter aestuariivivens]